MIGVPSLVPLRSRKNARWMEALIDRAVQGLHRRTRNRARRPVEPGGAT